MQNDALNRAPARAFLLEDRAVLEISGPDSRDFLQNIVTNDMRKALADRALYSALLTPQGKFLADFFVVLAGEDRFLLDCRADLGEAIAASLRRYVLRADVEIGGLSPDLAVAALLDPHEMLAPGAMIEAFDGLLFADPRHAGLGGRLIAAKIGLPERLAAAAYAPGTAKDYLQRRLELGIGEGGVDLLVNDDYPIEGGLIELGGLDLKKGCFVGQEVASRMKRKSGVRKKLCPLRCDGPVLAAGAPVYLGDVPVGEVRSAMPGRALALIRFDRLGAIGGPALRDLALTVAGRTASLDPPDWLDLPTAEPTA